MTSFTAKKRFFDSTLHQNRIHFLHVPIVPKEFKLWNFQLKITRRQSKYLFVIKWTKFGTYLHILDYFANLKIGNILTQSVKVWIHSQMIGIPEEFCSHLLFLRGKLLMFLCIQRHRNNSGIPVGKNHVPSEFFMNADRKFCKNSSFFYFFFCENTIIMKTS